MVFHPLKTVNPYFQALWEGKKNFEVRKNDRHFKVGDTLVLQEYDKDFDAYSGRQVSFTITYILDNFPDGLKDGYVVLGLNRKERWVPFGTQS